MPRIKLRTLVALALLVLPIAALGSDSRAWGSSAIEAYRHAHPHHITTGHIQGFRVILRDDDITEVGYVQNSRDHGLFFSGDRHRYTSYPHRRYNHDSRLSMGNKWPARQRSSQGVSERERQHRRQPGWSGHGMNRH